MMRRRATIFLALTLIFFATRARGDSIAFSVNLIVNTEEATSIGRATYDSGFCLDCRMHGNHRINGGSAIRTNFVDSQGNGHYLRSRFWRHVNGHLQFFAIDGLTFQAEHR